MRYKSQEFNLLGEKEERALRLLALDALVKLVAAFDSCARRTELSGRRSHQKSNSR